VQRSDDTEKRAALTCYCDDSGSHEESKFAVVGGIVLDRKRFVAMHHRWYEILKDFRLSKIHMKDFVRPGGCHCTLPAEMKIALFTSVTDAILEYKFYSVSAAVPQIDYKRLLSERVYRKFIGAYALAFLSLYCVNNYVGQSTGHLKRMAYLIDKGSDHHHEQLHGAHTAILRAEEKQGWSFTGAMAADSDDNNYALQAADVIAWAHHRKLESQDFGAEFQPLMRLLEQKVPVAERIKLHLGLDIPLEGVEFFAGRVNYFIGSLGKIPTWEEMLASHANPPEVPIISAES
jgi:hypothetical protein